MVTPAGASSFFAHPSAEKADTFEAPSGKRYRVTDSGGFVRIDEQGTVNMPSVGTLRDTGGQTVDHEYSIAATQTKEDATGASITVKENGKPRVIKALRGVQVGEKYFAVFAVKPSFKPTDIESLTRTTATSSMTLR